MDTPTQTPNNEQEEKSKKLPVAKSARPWILVLIIISLALTAALLWCWFFYKGGHSADSASPAGGSAAASAAATGPCKDGAENTLPAGFSWYENASLGYKFAYPTAWGAVTVTTTPVGGTGDYVQGHFAAKASITFGGNALDFVVPGRDGLPTDLPGYLKAGGKFYTVELWKYTDGVSITDRDDLHLIDMPYEEKQACNTAALVTNWSASELSSIGPADIVRFNLQPTNKYYGVNFVVDKPDAATKADVNKLIASFQLIP